MEQELRNVKIKDIQILRDKETEEYVNPRRQGRMIHSDLAASLESEGLQHPIYVMEVDSELYLLDGDRRIQAAKELGWKTIDAVVKIGQQDALKFMMLSNMREPLRPTAQAHGIVKLRVDTPTEWPVVRIAKALGKSVEEVDILITLYSAPEDVKRAVDQFYATGGKVGMSLAAYKAMRSKPKEVQQEVAAKAATDKVSVSQVKTAVKTDEETGNVLFDMFASEPEGDLIVTLNSALMAMRISWKLLPAGSQLKVKALVEQFTKIMETDDAK